MSAVEEQKKMVATIDDALVVNVGLLNDYHNTLRGVVGTQFGVQQTNIETRLKKTADTTLNMSNFSVTGLPDLSNDFSVGPLGDPEGTHAVRKRYLRQNFATLADNELKANQSTTYTKTETDASLILKANQSTTYNKTETDASLLLKGDKTYVDSQDELKADKLTTYTKTEADTLLLGKKNTGTFDSKIQNSTGLSAISCDGDRYISIKSNGNQLGQILEDEVNSGLTILTNDKRLNLVAT